MASSVEGTYQVLFTLPFSTEYESVEPLAALAEQLGGIDGVDCNSVAAYVSALLFQHAVEDVVASGEPLNRETLFAALQNTHDFDAGGIIGSTDVGNHKASPCFVMTQVIDGAWKRVHPEEPGTFNCDADNLTEVTAKMFG